MTELTVSPFTFRGVSGLLRLGGRTVARLGRWSGTLDTGALASAGAWTVTATIVGTPNTFWLADGGSSFDLTLDMGAHRWRWADVAVDVDKTTLTIHGTGRPEVL